MGDAWFTEVADELARLLVDARACADACEAYLSAHPEAIHDLAAPVAVARVLIDLIDHPPELVLAAVRLCLELTVTAAGTFTAPEVVTSLRTVAASATALLDAAV
jgi:hypothetical protein